MEGAESSMTNPSAAQIAYDKKQRKNQRIVWFFRIFILIAFLFLWEISTRLKWIDSFIFSSPSRVISTFITMWT